MSVGPRCFSPIEAAKTAPYQNPFPTRGSVTVSEA